VTGRSRPLISVAMVGVLLMTASGAGASSSWTRIPSPNSPGSNELLGAAGSDSTHVWAVGRVVSDSSPSTWRSLILRWNGSVWSPVPHPAFAENHLLSDVDAPGAGDAWAVGNRWLSSGGVNTLVEHWDGSAWRVVTSPNPNPGSINQLLDVKAVPSQPNSVWAVGSYDDPATAYGELTLTMRRTRGRWRVVPSPNVTSDNHLEAVDATGPNDAWAVGWGSTGQFGGTAVPIILHWDGTRWSTASITDPAQMMLFGVRAVSPNDVWAVGHTYPGGPHWVPVVLHWDGSAWTRATIPSFDHGGQLRDVVSLSPPSVHAVGFAGEGTNSSTLALRWNGTSWVRELTPSPSTGPKLFGAAAVAPNTAWGVGYRYHAPLLANQTLTLRRTG
jgi:hypothetical protein